MPILTIALQAFMLAAAAVWAAFIVHPALAGVPFALVNLPFSLFVAAPSIVLTLAAMFTPALLRD